MKIRQLYILPWKHQPLTCVRKLTFQDFPLTDSTIIWVENYLWQANPPPWTSPKIWHARSRKHPIGYNEQVLDPHLMDIALHKFKQDLRNLASQDNELEVLIGKSSFSHKVCHASLPKWFKASSITQFDRTKDPWYHLKAFDKLIKFHQVFELTRLCCIVITCIWGSKKMVQEITYWFHYIMEIANNLVLILFSSNLTFHCM